MTTETKTEWTLANLQRELPAWQARNFPGRPAHQPLLGVFEEIGELHEARSTEDVRDACADIIVFMADFSNAVDIDLEELHRTGLMGPNPATPSLIVSAGRLAHAFLKHEQGIRGTPEQHRHNMKAALTDLLAGVHARAHGSFDLVEVVRETWASVSQRVWRCQRQGCGKGLTQQGSHYCPGCEPAA